MRIVKNGDLHISAPIGVSRKEIEHFMDNHSDWIHDTRAKVMELSQHRTAFYQQLPLQTRQQVQEASQRLHDVISPMVRHHAAIMGVQPGVIRYKAMISRWGMCSLRDHSICFSLYLLLLPEWLVEHVVVHELCHLLEPSHNARFHQLMDHYFPRWKEARRETRRLLS